MAYQTEGESDRQKADRWCSIADQLRRNFDQAMIDLDEARSKIIELNLQIESQEICIRTLTDVIRNKR